MWWGLRFHNEFADKKKKKGTTIDQLAIVLRETAAWHYKEVSKISLLSNIWPAERQQRTRWSSTALLPWINLQDGVREQPIIRERTSRDSQSDPRITEHKENHPFLPTSCGLQLGHWSSSVHSAGMKFGLWGNLGTSGRVVSYSKDSDFEQEGKGIPAAWPDPFKLYYM